MWKYLYNISTENVLKTVISLYMEGHSLSFPTLEEVVVCTTETTEEEVSRIISGSRLEGQYLLIISSSNCASTAHMCKVIIQFFSVHHQPILTSHCSDDMCLQKFCSIIKSSSSRCYRSCYSGEEPFKIHNTIECSVLFMLRSWHILLLTNL